MKIAFCASEVVPFAKTGGLADVAGALPIALEVEGQEVIVILPKYKGIKKDNAVIGENIKVYFIENDEYYNRDFLYGAKTGDYKDNLERFAYYCRKSLELLKEIKFCPDIIHCHDWQAALIPVYLKNLYQSDAFYKNTKTVLTIHNLGYQGLFPKEQFPELGLDSSRFNMDTLEFFGRLNLLKGGLEFADIINTVSPTYSQEIQGEQLGFGLEGVLNKRKDSLFGILNGVDYSIWNPETDKSIVKNYSLKNKEGKCKNKEDLQKTLGLEAKKEIMLLGMISRIVQPKGFDILSEGLGEFAKMPLQLVVLGMGEVKYCRTLEKIAKSHPKSISVNLRFDDPLAHKIYAGSDAFLMPSQYEPCGLGQLISLRYGTIPVVFKTGGLADTVNKSNGFIFEHYTTKDLLRVVGAAVDAFKDKFIWNLLIENAMKGNFSWDESAKKYIELYAKAKAA